MKKMKFLKENANKIRLKVNKDVKRSTVGAQSSGSLNGLSFIPTSVRFEAGSYIDLDFIGQSIFMPWKWHRIKDISPENANITLFASDFIGEIKYSK